MKLTCDKCLEFVGNKNEVDQHKLTCGTTKPVYKATPPEPKVVPDKRLSKPLLTYVYTGACTKCGGQLATIEIDVMKKHFCIAYCNRCDTQVESREVTKL